jgi:hypothetical protein
MPIGSGADLAIHPSAWFQDSKLYTSVSTVSNRSQPRNAERANGVRRFDLSAKYHAQLRIKQIHELTAWSKMHLRCDRGDGQLDCILDAFRGLLFPLWLILVVGSEVIPVIIHTEFEPRDDNIATCTDL